MFYLERSSNRNFEIMLDEDGNFNISGDYYHYDGEDVKSCKNSHEELSLKNFLGVSKNKISPYKKVVFFISIPILLTILERLFFITQYSLFSLLLVIVKIIFVATGITLLFSGRRYIELLFVNSHICIRQNSLSREEYDKLIDALMQYKKQLGFY